jgi:hypothetical protein
VTDTGKQRAGDLAEINISRTYPERELYLQDIAEVEYIPLETNDNTLIGVSRTVYVSDNYIIIINVMSGDVLVFDGKGKSKFSFNHKGQSGTEYIYINAIAFDEKAKELFISDRSSAVPKFLVYAEDGTFKRSLPIPPDFSPRDMFSFDDATLLVYDEFGLNNDQYSNKPYVFISKNDGTVVDTLGIHLPVRVSNRVMIEVEINGQTGIAPLTIRINNNRSYGKNFLIADWSSDTLYRLTPTKELQPVIVRTPSVQKSDPKIVLSNELITNKYIFFTKAVFDFEAVKKTRSIPTMNLAYDFETGQLNEYKLINKDYEVGNVGFEEAITPENTGVYRLDVPKLFEADETGKVKGVLKELLKTLDEEDNPVLVKVRFN